MSGETWTAASDVVLAGGTLSLAFLTEFKKPPFLRTWLSLFITLALAAAFGAFYHGFDSLRIQSMWTLTSAASTASIFAFLTCCICLAKPDWQWLGSLWPLTGLFGFITGAMLAGGPFWHVSLTAGVVSLIGAFLLTYSPLKESARWIWVGLAVTILGLLSQKALPHRDDFMNNNVIFHLLQVVGNVCFYRAASLSSKKPQSG